MPDTCPYGFDCDIELNYKAVMTRYKACPKKGFQVYTQLNVHEIIGEACKDNFGRYLIIVACNPECTDQLFLPTLTSGFSCHATSSFMGI